MKDIHVNNRDYYARYCLLFLIGMLCLFTTMAQEIKHTSTVFKDSNKTLSPFVQKVIDAAKKDRLKNELAFNMGRIAAKQRVIGDELTRTAQEIKIYLNSMPEPALLKNSIIQAKKSYDTVKDGIFENKGTIQTERNLTVSSVVLASLINNAEKKKKQIDEHAKVLSDFRNKLDSLLSDPAIYAFPEDSAALMKYLIRLRMIAQEGNPSDNALNENLVEIEELQNEIDGLLFNLHVSYDQIELFRKDLADISLRRELPDIWAGIGYYRPFREILHFSYVKEKMAFQFYIRDKFYSIWVLCFAIAGMFYIETLVVRRLKQNTNGKSYADNLIVKHPFVSALFTTLSISLFFFTTAPFIFSVVIWTICAVCLILLCKNYITAYWLRFWIVMSILFLITCADNLVLQASRTERWGMLVLASIGIVYGTILLYSKHRSALKERNIIFFIRFLVIIESISFILNVFGRYNLSKILLNVGYTGIVVAIIFIWVIRLLGELLNISSILYKQSDHQPAFLKIGGVGEKVPVLFYSIFGVAWLLIVGRQFYLLKRIVEPVKVFLYEQREIGDYTFSINSMFLFIVIMLCSMILSRIISFFGNHGRSMISDNADKQKNIAGSWILLARIIVVTLGVFLAFAASGLPMDRLTIVLGALGVGIGLGLQSLVSNLVSGLIIAFEKPINLGDLVEINGKAGYVRSIGFRSSIVELVDGATLVVPNGDILNTHLVNWSLTRSIKRIVISVTVTRQSSPGDIKALLESIVAKNHSVLHIPKPLAVAKNLKEEGIDFDLIFWVRITEEALVIDSVITAINKEFDEKGITMSVPKSELYWTGNKGDDK